MELTQKGHFMDWEYNVNPDVKLKLLKEYTM
jgi:hypothetical protein